jgi:hypothetical protein
LSNAAIEAAWPRWWSAQADSSASARAELAFGVARRLGLEPESLIDDREGPRFSFRAEARFKHGSAETKEEEAGIASFGQAIAALLLAAAPPVEFDLTESSAGDLRTRLLIGERPFVALGDLLTIAWMAGIPVGHLRVFPWERKRMAAMSVGIDGRAAILLGKDSRYPSPIAFYLAHELGHIALGHTAGGTSVVDMGPELSPSEDQDELAADRYALELLTGRPDPQVFADRQEHVSGRAVAKAALEQGPLIGIEPGMLAQCFGYSTGDWPSANAALRYIYPKSTAIWAAVNEVAWTQLDETAISDDADDFLRTVLGTSPLPPS